MTVPPRMTMSALITTIVAAWASRRTRELSECREWVRYGGYAARRLSPGGCERRRRIGARLGVSRWRFGGSESKAEPTARRCTADLRRHRGAVRRPVSGRTGRCRPRPPRPRRRPRPVRPQNPQDPHHPHGAQLHHGGRPPACASPSRTTSTPTVPTVPGRRPIWAVNIHGYFAGGGMYWRESARLAEQLGWRVINPSLPGFGGSDPLDWHDVSMETLANQVMAIVHQVDAGPVVVLGHSMGGAVAVQFAHDHPRRTLGVIYRDGVSTPAWKDRHGIIPTLLSPIPPDIAPDGRHDRAGLLRPARPRHGPHVLHRALGAARRAAATSAPWARPCPSAAC